jgi:hypothetical protein
MTLGIEDLLELLRLPMLRVALRIEDYLELLRLPTLRVACKISRNVQEALMDRRWISDIQGSLSVGVIAEFLTLWDALRSVELQPEKEDNHIFRLANNGKYSAQAAYESLFWDLLSLSLAREFDICGLLRNVNFSCGLWLTKDVGLLIGCRNGDSHTLTVALFVIKNLKKNDHLLVGCVFSRQF